MKVNYAVLSAFHSLLGLQGLRFAFSYSSHTHTIECIANSPVKHTQVHLLSLSTLIPLCTNLNPYTCSTHHLISAHINILTGFDNYACMQVPRAAISNIYQCGMPAQIYSCTCYVTCAGLEACIALYQP